MKILRFNEDRIGVTDGRKVVDITSLVQSDAGEWPPVGINRLIRDFDELKPQIQALLDQEAGLPFDEVKLLTPVPWPNKLIAYPVNYHDHAVEMNSRGIAPIQGFFLKSNSSLIGAGEAVELPDLPGREIHHECELGIIIGKSGREISREQAFAHIFGYACLLDMTVRGREERVMRKSYETFTPVGPWIITADEVQDPTSLDMRLWVNDDLRQKANTRDLIVDIPDMIAIASSAMTLYPGDIIATGTPAGVDKVVAGDLITIEIEQVGRMQVRVVQGSRGRNIVFEKPYEFVRHQ